MRVKTWLHANVQKIHCLSNAWVYRQVNLVTIEATFTNIAPTPGVLHLQQLQITTELPPCSLFSTHVVLVHCHRMGSS